MHAHTSTHIHTRAHTYAWAYIYMHTRKEGKVIKLKAPGVHPKLAL